MLIKLIKKTSHFHDSAIIYKNQHVELTLQYVLFIIHIYIYTLLCARLLKVLGGPNVAFLIKSLELRCHVHIFLLFVLLYSNTRDAYLVVTMHFIYIYIYIHTECSGLILRTNILLKVLTHTSHHLKAWTLLDSFT